MAIYLGDIASVSINYQRTASAGARLGIALLFGYESGLPANVSYIGSEQELIDTYGLADTDPTYLAAQAAFAQADAGAILIPRMAIAKRLANVAQISHVTFSSAVSDADYTATVTYDGTEYAETITADGTATVKEIVEALAAALNGSLPAPSVAVTEDDTKLILTAETAGIGFSVTASSTGSGVTATIATATANRNAATQLSALELADPEEAGYYYVVPVGSGSIYAPDQDIEQITLWAEAQQDAYMGVFLTSNYDYIDPTVTDDLGSVLKTAKRTRCVIVVDDAGSPVHTAVMGWILGRLPSEKLGGWHHLSLSGVDPSSYDSSDFTSSRTKRVNAYFRIANNTARVFMPGLCISQLEARQRIGLDALTLEIQTAILDLFTRAAQANTVIPNTAKGKGQIKSVVDPVLARYATTDRQLFQTAPTCDMSNATFADGLLSGVTFSGTRADAVLLVQLNGKFQ